MRNSKKNTNWILCPSKSIPGKFYYFNVVTGEAVWGDDTDVSFSINNLISLSLHSFIYYFLIFN